MRILRFGSVLGFASTVRFYHGFLNGLLMTFLGYETTQSNAWLNLPKLVSRAVIDNARIDESTKNTYRLSISKKAQHIDSYAN